MPRRILICLLLALACLTRAADSPDAASPAFFTERVRPLLEGRCLECHGELKHKGKLKLNERAAMLAGGVNGPAIVPGDPEHSLVVTRVRARGTDDVMPPVEPALDDQQIADLAAWIAAGATWVHADGSVEPAPAATGGEQVPTPTGAQPTEAPTAPAAKPAPPPLIGRVHPLV